MKLSFLTLIASSASVFNCVGEPDVTVQMLSDRFDAQACDRAVVLATGGRPGKNGHTVFRQYEADRQCVDQLLQEMEMLGFAQLDDETYIRTPENNTSEQMTIKLAPGLVVYEIEWLEWGFDI